MTRKAKLSTERIDQICSLVRMGSYLSVAAQAVGVTDKCVHDWLREGREALDIEERMAGKLTPRQHLCKQFVEKYQIAQAEAEINDLRRIDIAADELWTAAAWKLERKNPERWGRKDNLAISGEVTQNINITHVIVNLIQTIESTATSGIVNDEFIRNSDDAGNLLIDASVRTSESAKGEAAGGH